MQWLALRWLALLWLLRLACALDANRKFFVSTSPGLEKILFQEVKGIIVAPASVKLMKSNGVMVTVPREDYHTPMRMLLSLRTSLRVMELLDETEDEEINSKDDLYNRIYEYPWHSIIDHESTLKVDTILAGSRVSGDLSHSHFTSLTIKNAIADKFRSKYNNRPSVDVACPDLFICCYLFNNKLTTYRVWNGVDSMHKRGYRTNTIHKAALKEHVAAGLVLHSNWNATLAVEQGSALVDPLCGSGTILIEAALIDSNVAPGLLKYNSYEDISIKRWKDLDPAVFDAVYRDLQSRDKREVHSQDKDRRHLYQGNDIYRNAVDLAIESSQICNVNIKYSCENAKYYAPMSEIQCIITNPPWDLRLENAEASWEALNTFVLANQRKINVHTLTANPDVLKCLKLKPKSQLVLSPSNVESRYIQFGE